MGANLESVFGAHSFFEIFHQTLIEMDTRAAVVANDVVVVLAWFDNLVAPLAISNVDCLHEPESDQRLQRAIDRSQTRCIGLFGAQLTVNILSAAQRLGLFEDFKNFFAAFGEAGWLYRGTVTMHLGLSIKLSFRLRWRSTPKHWHVHLSIPGYPFSR